MVRVTPARSRLGFQKRRIFARALSEAIGCVTQAPMPDGLGFQYDPGDHNTTDK
jgi:hypothetical protein